MKTRFGCPSHHKTFKVIATLTLPYRYRFGSTGVVQVLSRAAELLGLVPVFPVRNVTNFSSGASNSNAVFRDCVLVNRGTTVAEVARKVMGDAPLAYVEGAGGVRVAEDDLVSVGKNDVSFHIWNRKDAANDYRYSHSKLDEDNLATVYGIVKALKEGMHSIGVGCEYNDFCMNR